MRLILLFIYFLMIFCRRAMNHLCLCFTVVTLQRFAHSMLEELHAGVSNRDSHIHCWPVSHLGFDSCVFVIISLYLLWSVCGNVMWQTQSQTGGVCWGLILSAPPAALSTSLGNCNQTFAAPWFYCQIVTDAQYTSFFRTNSINTNHCHHFPNYYSMRNMGRGYLRLD